MIRQKVIDNYRDMVASLKTELKLAEAEVERLQKSYAITNESWQNLQAENAKLRKVAEAAREFISSTGCNPKECGKCDPKYIGFCRWSGIGQALAELDKEGER